MYRGRASPFHVGAQGSFSTSQQAASSQTPEDVLSDTLKQWMADLTSGADLSRSSLEKIYPPSVYKHCQDNGDLGHENLELHSHLRDWQQVHVSKNTSLDQICKRYNMSSDTHLKQFRQKNCGQVKVKIIQKGTTQDSSQQDQCDSARRDWTFPLHEWETSEDVMIWVLSKGGVDDYHSPLTPERYIALRLRPMMSFYQQRIPVYTRANLQMMLTLGVFSGLCHEWLCMLECVACRCGLLLVNLNCAESPPPPPPLFPPPSPSG